MKKKMMNKKKKTMMMVMVTVMVMMPLMVMVMASMNRQREDVDDDDSDEGGDDDGDFEQTLCNFRMFSLAQSVSGLAYTLYKFFSTFMPTSFYQGTYKTCFTGKRLLPRP